MTHVPGGPDSPDRWSTLSAGERRMGTLLAQGCADDEIARRLLSSPQSVEWAVAKLCRKLDVRSRAQLVALLNRSRGRQALGVERLLRGEVDARAGELTNEGGLQ